MIEHDMHVGELLQLLDELGIADNTIVQYSTDNGPHYNTWPDAGTTPFRSEKNSNWEGAYRVPCFIRWPGQFPAGEVRNGIVSHEDWLPTFAAAGGNPDINEQLKEGVELNGRKLQELSRRLQTSSTTSAARSTESPRKEFMYVNDDGQIVAMRYEDWKAVFLENRGQAFEVWREPFTELRVPLLFNLRRDPFEKAQHNSNTYNDWFLDRVYVLGPMQRVAGQVPHDDEGVSAQPETRLVQPGRHPEKNRSDSWRSLNPQMQLAAVREGGGFLMHQPVITPKTEEDGDLIRFSS